MSVRLKLKPKDSIDGALALTKATVCSAQQYSHVPIQTLLNALNGPKQSLIYELLGALTPTTNEYESTNDVDIFGSSDPEEFRGSATDSIMQQPIQSIIRPLSSCVRTYPDRMQSRHTVYGQEFRWASSTYRAVLAIWRAGGNDVSIDDRSSMDYNSAVVNNCGLKIWIASSFSGGDHAQATVIATIFQSAQPQACGLYRDAQ
ncbi:hypothetical protein SNOG_04895 [Parastagonospora nodorum SN15]|uniref:Uncharacterized protein n=1 Tax=Phaeosphaeria nodorum (strain SN15 / ATCC MYA-4574 / FGSC 10173) TaxID=321614 RepID=Q0UTL9_PHANO|nr:hypothetical protein SNOG_04895 [Parastagonospora nodorum SN15]EAT87286.1 hypothetical protein SNOG_04895 [Parastagonospora nodorum SN15]